MTATEAVAVAKWFEPDSAAVAEYDRLLTGPDQWTLQAASYRPLHRVALRDGKGTEVYVSNRTGLPMLETTTSTRNWAYAGAVLHWLYFTPFRQYGDVWLYLDPFRGSIVRKEVSLTRRNRWFYRGLHSLDFPFLYYRRPLWDAVVIVLSLGGLALSVTTLMPAWRRLRRHGRRHSATQQLGRAGS